jgi:hypothetical protein
MGQASQPGNAADALASVSAGLAALAVGDATELTTAEQADCLRVLERAQSQLVAARSVVLAAFTISRGFEDDAAGGPRSWLRWQTRITNATASDAVGWTQRLADHPAVAGALAAGEVSVSWARKICWWSDRLPQDSRAEADQILLDAAAGGAGLRDLAGLAEEIYRRTAPPDTDGGPDGFDSRKVRLLTHFRGAGQLDGDLTPDCAAALRAVLDSLSAKAGPEDIRTAAQREHDALAEACHRLIVGGLPDRAGQPTQIQLHMTLEQLLGLDGADSAAADWAGYGPTAGCGADCDASITPIITAHLDPAELAEQASDLLRGTSAHGSTSPGSTSPGSTPPDCTASGRIPPGRTPPGRTTPGTAAPGTAAPGPAEAGAADGDPATCPACATARLGQPCDLHPRTAGMAHSAARELVLSRAIRLLSGPAGLAAHLRGALLPQPAASISLPLDLGKPTETVPPYLRRAVIARDKHCAFPGCDQRPAACQVHHVIPRAEGGPTSVDNCCLLCLFHHQIAVHTWGWQLRLHPDGTTSATLGDRTIYSHAAPAA